ncbi:phosphoribosyl-AMP cyclohydrolase [Cysteiniphilum halobium]|uniref:phosphoribosyl-AMP cyclohydrolase n=1 Tax=Cysteiniphilum halobium TaxID=2219059 RepID=UPI000E6518DD|nr:phosphoribosyl-AMP cyclohydrolase [Cysteiniphilum halobium]
MDNNRKISQVRKAKAIDLKGWVTPVVLSLFLVLGIATVQKTNAAATSTTMDKKALTTLSQSTNNISVEEVEKAQSQWAAGIVAIGDAYTSKSNYKKVAKDLINKLYAYNYEKGVVMFKPTKAKEIPFRPTKESALAYFVGGNKNFKEDKGFALKPWTKVVFHNDEMYFHGDMAIAMGTYDFTDNEGEVTTVEYTFAYVKMPNGRLKIVLHHSSAPFSG